MNVRIILATAGTLALLISSGSAFASDLTSAIDDMLHEQAQLRMPGDYMTGSALDNDEHEIHPHYNHSISVRFDGSKGASSVEKQVNEAAEAALRIGHLVLQKGFVVPGKDLIIEMAVDLGGDSFTDTFAVRYAWADVLSIDKANGRIADLAAKGKIEQIWLKYWPTICLNQPPPELFGVGNGDDFPKMPEDVENPTGKDLSCHRR
jgi:hypothetical protein